MLLEPGFTLSMKGGAKEHAVNGYLVAAQGKTLCIFKAGACDVSNLEGANIAVGCAHVQVLLLWATLLQTRR